MLVFLFKSLCFSATRSKRYAMQTVLDTEYTCLEYCSYNILHAAQDSVWYKRCQFLEHNIVWTRLENRCKCTEDVVFILAGHNSFFLFFTPSNASRMRPYADTAATKGSAQHFKENGTAHSHRRPNDRTNHSAQLFHPSFFVVQIRVDMAIARQHHRP